MRYGPKDRSSTQAANVKIIIPGATNPNLSFEMAPDGTMGYYWKGLKLMFSGTYNEVLSKCLGMSGTPSS